MSKKRIFNIIAIILGIITCFSFYKVQAIEYGSTITRNNLTAYTTADFNELSLDTVLQISAQRETGNEYTFNPNTVGEAKTVWKIAKYSSNERDYSNLYYCLNVERGFGITNGNMAEGKDDKYSTTTFDMKDSSDKVNITNYAGGNLDTNYNKVLWVLDNSYIPSKNTNYQSSAEYINLMKDAGITIDSNKSLNLTEDDIEVIQQMVIWYFTNSSNSTYNSSKLPNLYLNGREIADIVEQGEYGQINVGQKRRAKAEALYTYFIKNASSNYTPVIPTLTLSNANAKVEEKGNNYIVGPFSLIGTNINLIKEISTNINIDCTLLDSSKNELKDNVLTGNDFYLKISKDEITESKEIKINLDYKYDIRTLTFLTDINDPENTQPVVLIKSEEKIVPINTKANIELTQISVEKIWDDNNNQDNVRPNSIKIELYKDGKAYSDITLNESNNWEYTWNKLLSKENGKVITYTVEETEVPDKYTVAYSTTDNKTIITNTHIPETIEKTVTKIWNDNNNQDSKRAEYGVTLKKNGEVYGEEVKLNAETLTYTWTNLPKYENGEEIVYTVEETTVPEGYTVAYSEDTFVVTNTYDPQIIEKTVTKVWNDNNNQDGKRAEYGVTLKKNGEVYGEEVKLNAETLTYTWTNLPKYENGEEIVYTVEETTVPEGYTVAYSEDTFVVTNTYNPETIEKTVTKVWDDNNNQDGKRTEYGVTLKKNGKVYGEEVKLNKDTLTYTWTNLPRYENGEEIVYTVEETTIPDEYTVTYSEDTFVITNKYTPGKISLKVTKIWDDQQDKDEIRPDSVIVKLYKTINGVKEELSSQRLDENNNWMHIWTELDEKYNGQKITYSIEENPVEKYETTYSAENYNNTNEITITNSYIPVEITGKYNVLLRKVDENGNILNGSKFKVSGTEYDLSTGEVTIYENQQITEENLLNGINFTYILQETVVPVGYNGIENTEINIKAQVQKVENQYKLIRATLVDGEGNNITDESISIKLEGESIVIIVKNTPIEKVFDLSLRKFITKVNDIEYSRSPIVDTSTIASTGTATYKHIKEPVPVQKGDIVTYTIRVYNEGEVDGYVDKITDYIPDNLIPLIVGTEGIDEEKYAKEIDFNLNWGWKVLEGGKAVTTTVMSKINSETYSILTGLEDVTDTKLDAYVEGTNKLDYIDVQIKCLVADTASSYEYLTNIAEITESQDINGNMTDGIDSILGNVDYSNLSDYKNEEAMNSTVDTYIPGQEDDDDFEKLVVKEFDLSLRKFITKVNDVMYARVPIVDTSKLGTWADGKLITTATYNHSKTPVIVETGDIVTYTIRIYNEGTLEGFANEITDNIPEGLEFLPESDINISYNWKMLDSEGNITEDISKASMIVTDYLSDADSNNIINHVTEENGQKVLSYKDVEVQFKVIAEPKNLQDNIIINEAQISADSDRDIDSVPNRDEKYDYDFGNNEDDIDYEPIKLEYFDLALRKFITKVNSVDYNNRYPEINYNEDGSIKYVHTKDPVLVTTNDTVVYTIRVYNEGEKAGYATEIKDNLPDGLAFDPENEVNKQYGWKMLDSEGNVTEDASKVVAFSTDYLKNELIDAFVSEGDKKILSYKDVQIAFIVVEPNTSDRILVNTAQISNDSDDDIDSAPNNNVEAEDDLDKEYVRVQYFDLALKKWVTRTEVTYNGKTTTTKTGFDEDTDDIAKVDLVASKMNKTTVKFAFNIKVTNEGELPGYAYEVKDYIPKGLKFVAEDNKDWKELEDGTVVTEKLKDTLLNPGESATVEIILTWKNSTTNTGLKTNYAEISKDSAEDFDSIPDNYDFTEDDIDDAQVILSIKTAGAPTYIGLVLITVAILAGGIFLIKRYVID